jgi:predicted GNAT family N-acyltransferase
MVTLHSRRPEKPSYLYLDYLASHPKNLISPVNVCEQQVGGSAVKLLNHLTEEVCPQSNMEQIRLHSTKNAVSFYKKFGFEQKSKCMKLQLNSYKKL